LVISYLNNNVYHMADNVSFKAQWQGVAACLCKCAVFDPYSSPRSGKTQPKTLLDRLRWVTLGYHYNWDTKVINSTCFMRGPWREDLINVDQYSHHKHTGFQHIFFTSITIVINLGLKQLLYFIFIRTWGYAILSSERLKTTAKESDRWDVVSALWI